MDQLKQFHARAEGAQQLTPEQVYALANQLGIAKSIVGKVLAVGRMTDSPGIDVDKFLFLLLSFLHPMLCAFPAYVCTCIVNFRIMDLGHPYCTMRGFTTPYLALRSYAQTMFLASRRYGHLSTSPQRICKKILRRQKGREGLHSCTCLRGQLT
eukprot:1158807-Pelagomonas_calceolata.AAC.1